MPKYVVLRALSGQLPVQPRLMALHEPEHCRVGEVQVPEPAPFATLPVTLATSPRLWNCNLTAPLGLIWPNAATGVSPAELTLPPDTRIVHW
jgi:hypothetical protein